MGDDDAFFEAPEAASEHGAMAVELLDMNERIGETDFGDPIVQLLNQNDYASLNNFKEEEELAIALTDFLATPPSNVRMEVQIPEMPLARRNEYLQVHSDIVEFVVEELSSKPGQQEYEVEFTDGRKEKVAFAELAALENGKAALYRFGRNLGPDGIEMADAGRKRKYESEDEWGSGAESSVSDRMAIDEDDDLAIEQPHSSRHDSRQYSRALRSRTTTRQSSRHASLVRDDDDDDDDLKEEPSIAVTRSLRARPPRQATLNFMSVSNRFAGQDQDELLNDPRTASTDEEDGNFEMITSDLLGTNTKRSRRGRKKSRRLQLLGSQARASARAAAQRRSPDSDIEFEAPRRSGRSTRNKASMYDEALMDEDSFYVVDDKAPGAPKIISIREVFLPPPPDSPFALMHLEKCHTCGGSKQRGQIVHCQGCTLSYHKNCLGYRSARDHMVTKVGEENFVLQCRYCVGIYTKKDPRAPKHSACQTCLGEGRACAPFSEKKTARQEENLREQNGGVDPITVVSSELIDNPENVLFRCVTCHRGWHVDHLPSTSSQAIGTDVKSERLKDYSVDWQCNDCSKAQQKIHRLVAWRPRKDVSMQSQRASYAEVSEDNKEYLIKWETTSYAHCTWMPGAWVFGIAPATMRTSFGKRDAEHDLLKMSEQEAIPEEFVMPDVILNTKMDSHAPKSRTKEAELANISKVSKIYVKFQGLGYDDVVWDTPPTEDKGKIYEAFVEAYYEYIEGKYFQTESFNKIRDRVRSFKSSTFTEIDEQPKGLQRGKLMGYQLEGLNWLLGNYHHGRSVVLADEMGLGKTIQVVSLLTSLIQDKPKCWPFLVVVPNSTCPNWRREFHQWSPELRVVTYHGGKEPQELAYKYELFPNSSADMKAHVVIMSYDSAQDPRTKTLFKDIHWQGLVVDEGQRLKNDQNLLYIALREMKIPFRLLLTGTPLQNNKRELFNLLQFIDEKQDAAKLDEEYQVLDKESLPKLHERIRPYFLRRTKAGVLKFLPPMAQIILPVTMTVLQEKLSKSIMAKNPELIKAMFANSKMKRKERGSLNNILMQLRKCLCHPFIYSDAIEEKHHDTAVLHRNLVEASAKLLLLEIMLPKLKERGHRVLIFSQFLQQLDIIEDFLSGMGYEFRRLDGQIGSLEKQRRIDAFNAPDSSIFAFLLSTRAGGVGINLATADTVIIMDPDFNPHQDIQALSRAHRIGQKHKVLCFQLMTKDSVEERIMQVGRKKMALDHALIESMDDDELAGDDLESILKHGAQALFNDDYQKQAIQYDSASVDKLLDRTQIEQTKTNEEGSAETQFSYARVWANDKAGFEENISIEEETEPVPLNSSVWDRIIEQREAEARREAEANREILGRGGRRRMVVNYKTNMIDGALVVGDAEGESSDSSDDFAAADSGGESDGEDEGLLAKDAQKDFESIEQTNNPRHTQTHKDPNPGTNNAQTQQGRRKRQENKAATTPHSGPNSGQTTQEGKTKPGGQRQRQQQPWQYEANSFSGIKASGPHIPGHDAGGNGRVPSYPAQNPAVPAGAPYSTSRPDFSQYLAQNAPQHGYSPQAFIPPLASNGGRGEGRQELRSEAQLRLAIDYIQHSAAINIQAKARYMTTLMHQLRALGARSGKQQH